MVPNAYPEDRAREEALSELEQTMVQAGLASYHATSNPSNTPAQTPTTDRQQKLALLANTLQRARQLIAELRDGDYAPPASQDIRALLEALASHLDNAVDQLENAKQQLENLRRVVEKADDPR